MAKTIVIVGASGTVGLDLVQRLQNRETLVVKQLDARAAAVEREAVLAGADMAVLCLPEKAALDFVANASPDLRILDASSAHRTADGWTYGLPELGGDQAQRIRSAKRVANPGCYATGAILLLRPLRAAVPADWPLQVAITGVGGFTSGGRKMIADASAKGMGYRLYGLDQDHRHIPEIQHFSGLSSAPIFMPSIAGHERGTLVQIPFSSEHLGLTYEQVLSLLQEAYKATPHVRVVPDTDGVRYLDAAALAGTDDVVIQVHTDASRTRFVLTAQFDNLGKGATGAAEQNIVLMLDLN